MFSLRRTGWQRPRYVLGACPPCVRHVSALIPLRKRLPSPRFVRCVLALCPPRVRLAGASKPFPPCSCVCLVCVRPDFARSWPAVGQGRCVLFIFQYARWSVSLAFTLASQIRPLQAHPILEKLFGVYAGIIFDLSKVYQHLKSQSGITLKKKVSSLQTESLPISAAIL